MSTFALPKLPDIPLKGASKAGAPAPDPLSAPALMTAPPVVRCFRVAPPVMPPLPMSPPPANAWAGARNPSARIVQQQYIDLRQEELGANRKPFKKAALAVIEEYLLRRVDPGKKHKKIPYKELKRVYKQIEQNLQSADLTINFHVDVWFKNESTYDTYTQMYENGIDRDQMVLNSDGMNDARLRAAVDNQVTFPEGWQNVQTPLQRGLSPGRQGADRIMRQMDTGPLVPKPVTKRHAAYNASNPHFNPHAKQIFLGLNYGRRPHGSAMNFGKSYIVFKSELKPACFFFVCDTFLARDRPETNAGNLQVPFDNLGGILGVDEGRAAMLRESIFQSCYEGATLSDPHDSSLCKFYLLEAHYFGELNFRRHADYMVISRGSIEEDPWRKIAQNARKFADRQGIKLYQTD